MMVHNRASSQICRFTNLLIHKYTGLFIQFFGELITYDQITIIQINLLNFSDLEMQACISSNFKIDSWRITIVTSTILNLAVMTLIINDHHHINHPEFGRHEFRSTLIHDHHHINHPEFGCHDFDHQRSSPHQPSRIWLS